MELSEVWCLLQWWIMVWWQVAIANRCVKAYAGLFAYLCNRLPIASFSDEITLQGLAAYVQ